MQWLIFGIIGIGGALFALAVKAKAAVTVANQSTRQTDSVTNTFANVDTTLTKTDSSYADTGAALGSKVPIVGSAIGRTIGGAVEEIVNGNPTVENVATAAFLPVSVTATAVNAISDFFGFGGKPLDPVERVLLMTLTHPGLRDNIQINAGTIWALDTNGYRHATNGDLNTYGFSWREVIAVDSSILSQFPISPVACRAPGPQPFTVQKRPTRAEDMRTIFGYNCIFKLADSNEVHGQWEVI